MLLPIKRCFVYSANTFSAFFIYFILYLNVLYDQNVDVTLIQSSKYLIYWQIKLKKMKASVLKTELETCLQQLDTQTRVARQVEHERDKANDELEFAKVLTVT